MTKCLRKQTNNSQLSLENGFRFHNVYSFDLITNKMELILKNKRFPMFVTDNELNIRLASEETIDGKLAYYK